MGSDVTAELAAGNAYGIEPVSTLSGVTGDHVGQIKLLTTTDTLYVWTGSAWSTDIFTASNVDPGSITAASFASGVEPISAVSSLPSPTGYTGPSVVFLTSDKKLYRYDSSVPEFTTLINTSDLTGTLASGQFSNGLRPIEVLSSLPTTGNFQGRTVLLTTDNKLYRYTGTSFTKAISAADLDDQLNLATQAQGLLPVANAASGLVNSNVTINADGTLSGAGSGQATLTGLGAGQVATLDAITETYIGDNAISTAKIQANAITSNLILAGAIGVSELAANSVTANAVAANSISSASLQTGAVVADSIASGAIVAGKLGADSISSTELQSDSVGASEIIANSITASELNVSSVFADSAVIGAIQSSAITAAAIDAAVANFEFVESVNIASDAITAGKIAANAVEADAINVTNLAAISADLGTITAGTVNADVIKIDNVTLDTDGSNNLIVKNGGVDTTQIASGAVSITANSYTSGGVTTSSGSTQVQSVTYTSTGADAYIMVNLGFVAGTIGGVYAIAFDVYDGSTIIHAIPHRSYANGVTGQIGFSFTHTPSAGSRTISVEVKTGAFTVFNRGITIIELKR